MILDVVDDGSGDGAALGFAKLAQRMCSELVAPVTSPTSMVVSAAAIIAVLAAAFRVELVRGVHGGMLAQPESRRTSFIGTIESRTRVCVLLDRD